MYYEEDREPADEREQAKPDKKQDENNAVRIALYYVNHSVDE